MAGDQRKFQVAMTHADRFSQEGKWTEAMRAYRFALAEFPNSEAAIMGFGRVALAMDQIEIARRGFSQVLKLNPTNLNALGHMADIQERSGQLDAAAETYLRVGNVHASKEDFDAAIDSWTRATKLSSGQTNAHLKIADALARQGKVRQAAREYLQLAAMYQRRGDNAQATKHIEAAQMLLPDDPGIAAAFESLETGSPIQPQKIGEAPPEPVEPTALDDELDDLFDDDDLFGIEHIEAANQPTGGLVDGARQDALAELANILFEDSDNPHAMVIMQALNLQSNDNVPEAINLYQQAIQSGATQGAMYFNLGFLYRERGQLNEAAEMLERSATDPKYKISSLFSLGLIYQSTGKFDVAAKYFIEALKTLDLQTVSGQRSYALAQTYENLAESYSGQVDADKLNKFAETLQRFFANSDWQQRVYEARQRMNKVGDEKDTMSLAEFLETPETEVVITTLALTGEFMKNNLFATASEECLRAIQKAPSFLPLHSRLAEIMLKQDRTDQAITKYLYIANVYQMRYQPEQSVNMYQKILKLAPMDVTVRSKLIDMYTSLGNAQQALRQYLVLADSYYQLAQVERALEKYNEALRMANNSPDAENLKVDILSRMADIYNQRFDWANAAASYQELHKLDPKNELFLRRLTELYFRQNGLSDATSSLDKLIGIYQRQNPLQVLELLKELSSFYPDNLNLRQRLAIAYAQNNRKSEAIAEYDALGEMQLEKGLRDEAVQTIQAIINLGPDDVEGYRRLLGQIGGGAL